MAEDVAHCAHQSLARQQLIQITERVLPTTGDENATISSMYETVATLGELRSDSLFLEVAQQLFPIPLAWRGLLVHAPQPCNQRWHSDNWPEAACAHSLNPLRQQPCDKLQRVQVLAQ